MTTQRNAYDRLSMYKTAIYTKDAITYIVYHQTDIVQFTYDLITLDHGGYRTVTTKKKMNQASHQFNLGYSVIQRKGVWYADYNGKLYNFDAAPLTFERPKTLAA